MRPNGMSADFQGHDCRFDEVIVEGDDGPLKDGMKVLIPCDCGESPLDHIELMETYFAEMQIAVKNLEPNRALYHWAPARRFNQIKRYGLRPWMRNVTETTRAPYVCFADDPQWAWRLSGGQPRFDKGTEWDLWMTWLDRLEAATILPSVDRPSGIYEVRNEARVYKRDLVYVASRFK